jgi:hypothetical protein
MLDRQAPDVEVVAYRDNDIDLSNPLASKPLTNSIGVLTTKLQ